MDEKPMDLRSADVTHGVGLHGQSSKNIHDRRKGT